MGHPEVDALLEHPTDHFDEVRDRLKGVPPKVVYAAIRDAARAAAVGDENWDCVGLMCGLLLGKGLEDEVQRLATDDRATWWARGAAARTLAQAEALQPKDRKSHEALVFARLADRDLERVPPAVVALFHACRPEDWPASADRVEGWRALAGISGDSLWPQVYARGVAGPLPPIRPLSSELSARAVITPAWPDGQFSAIVHLSAAAAPGLCSVVRLSVDPDGQLDVDLLWGLPEADAAFEREAWFLQDRAVEAPVGDVVGLAAEARVRGFDAPLLRMLLDVAGPATLEIPSAQAPDVDAVLAALDAPQTDATWLLDDRDMASIWPPEDEARALAVLHTPERTLGLRRAVRQLAAWWRWRGDVARASCFATIADTDDDVVILRALYRRSRVPYLPSPALAPRAPTDLRWLAVPRWGVRDYVQRLVTEFRGAVPADGPDPLPGVLNIAIVRYGTPLAWSRESVREMFLHDFPLLQGARATDLRPFLSAIRGMVHWMDEAWGLQSAPDLLHALGPDLDGRLDPATPAPAPPRR